MLGDTGHWLRKMFGSWHSRLFPLFPIALGLCLGILGTASPGLTAGGGRWRILAIICAVALLALWDYPSRIRLTGGLIGGIFLASLHLWSPWQTYSSFFNRTASGTVTAQITDPFTDPGPFEASDKRQRVTARISSLCLAGEAKPVPCSGKILLVLPEGKGVDYGDTVEASGVFVQPSLPLVAGQFDYRRYLRSQGIQYQLLANSLQVKENPSGHTSFKKTLYRLRQWLACRLVEGFKDESNARAAVAMTLGYRKVLDTGTRRSFMRSGAIHIFAISGLHVGIAMCVFLGFLRVLAVPFTLRYRLLPMILGLYVLLTGCPVSAMRAWVMITTLSLSYSMLRPHAPLNDMSLAAIILLFVNPLALFNSGFQFSFVIVLSLVLGWQLVVRVEQTCYEHICWMGKTGPFRYWLRRLIRKIFLAFACGLLAWLGSAGLVAWNNCLFIPSALWVNVVIAFTALGTLSLAVAKLTFVCLGLNCLTGPLTGVLEFLLAVIHSLVQTVEKSSGCMAVVQPAIVLVLLHYVLLFLFFNPKLSRRWRGGMLMVLLLNMAWIGGGANLFRGDKVTVIHGDGHDKTAGIIECSTGPPTVMFSGSYLVDMATLDTLKSKGYDRIQTALSPRSGAYAGRTMETVLTRLQVDHVCLPSNVPVEWNQVFPDARSAKPGLSVLAADGELLQGPKMPPYLLVDSFSRKKISFSLQGLSESPLKIDFSAKKTSAAEVIVKTQKKTFFQASLPASKNIQVLSIPLPPYAAQN